MYATIEHQGDTYKIDLNAPLDISLPLDPVGRRANAWYAPPFAAEPVRFGDFVGSVAEGGSVNFKNVQLNPHGNGTHTECVGHISSEPYTINQSLKKFWFMAELISIYPEKQENGDLVITREQVADAFVSLHVPEAVIIRTLPNDHLKMTRQYSGTNPPYLHHEAVAYLVEQGVEHLLLDLPSVDREEDEGKLLAHKAFWKYPGDMVRKHATITELVYMNNDIKDGRYLLNIQFPSFELDAAPSKPVLYGMLDSR